MGLDAVGVELSRKRAKKARNLRLAVPGVSTVGEPPPSEPESDDES
jgi:hypothetical protein